MMSWSFRSSEERALINPAVCSVLLWHAARGHARSASSGLPFDGAFLVLPMVLHLETRMSLPKSVRTSLAVWLEEHPLARPRIGDRARTLVPYTKEALTFGGLHGVLTIAHGAIEGNDDSRERVRKSLEDSSDEVRSCAMRAEFVGKWFATTGSVETVMALMGVRP